jgi:tripartite-type tricarboxylate transporter receptor subunit TctC
MGLALAAAVLSCVAAPVFAWEPNKTVTFVVPAGTGGGADQMARFIQGVISKHHLMNKPMVVVNESGGAGAQGFLDVKNSKGDNEKIIITLSNLFTTPLATGVPFSWKDFTPVAMFALDEFVLWVNSSTPYKTPMQYIDAVKKTPGKFKMGGTGSKQEDQIITAEIEQKTGAKFTYIPYKGGGTVAVQLVGGHIDSTVNNPIEQVAHWKAGNVRPLCVFDTKRMQYKQMITKTMSWNDIPTCESQGLPVTYLMLRGIFMPPDIKPDVVDYYVKVLKEVRATPEWKAYALQGAYNTTFMTGKPFEQWLEKTAKFHYDLMKKAGFLAKK